MERVHDCGYTATVIRIQQKLAFALATHLKVRVAVTPRVSLHHRRCAIPDAPPTLIILLMAHRSTQPNATIGTAKVKLRIITLDFRCVGEWTRRAAA